MFVCVVPSSHARARRKSASDFSFILYFSNASDSLKVLTFGNLITTRERYSYAVKPS